MVFLILIDSFAQSFLANQWRPPLGSGSFTGLIVGVDVGVLVPLIIGAVYSHCHCAWDSIYNIKTKKC